MIALLLILTSNIVAATALALLATFVGWSGRRAVIARWIWLAVFVKLVTPPVISVPIEMPAQWTGQFSHVTTILNAPRINVPKLALANAPELSLPAGDTSDSLGAMSSNADRSPSTRWQALSLVQLLVACWLSGSGWLLMRGSWRYWRMVKLLEQQAELDEAATQRVRELLRRSESDVVPVVRLIRARISPMLFGIGRRAAIVCPRELWLSLDEPQRLAFLAHESAHYARRDHWVRWLEWLVTSLYWWLPLVYWARVQLERHEEVACDAAALNLLKQQSSSPVRRSYAESLLNVVDFLSEAEPGVPRLASRMQPTAALEERLHWIMTSETNDALRLPWRIGIALSGLALLLHPTVQPWSPLTLSDNQAVAASVASSSNPLQHEPNGRVANDNPLPMPLPGDLPAAPHGWWNQSPEAVWADRQLGQNKLRLLAEAGVGIGVSQPGGSHFTFDTRDVRGLAFVAGSGRLVVGRNNGELHLWDTASARSVSLIGKHSSAVTSSCWSSVGGLVSCDQSGTIVRWDLQSGQMLASTTGDSPVTAVRWSSDGQHIGVLNGHWSQASEGRKLILLHGTSLHRLVSQVVPNDTAVIHHDAERGWLAIAWSGWVTELASSRVIAFIPKHEVSGVAMCAELMPELKLVPTMESTTAESTNMESTNMESTNMKSTNMKSTNVKSTNMKSTNMKSTNVNSTNLFE